MKKTTLTFENTEIAFSAKSDKELSLSYWMFRVINNNFLVKIGPPITSFFMNMGLPVSLLIKPTIFKHFCGGESIAECDATINQLAKYHVGTILDYSIEGEEKEAIFDSTAKEIIATILKAALGKNIPFTVFKVTGIGRFELLAKVQKGETLNKEEQEEYVRVENRVADICRAAFDKHVPVFIDAEESWIQDPIDELANAMMAKYNKKQAIIYNTFQMYRRDRLKYLEECIKTAKQEGYFLGVKLVRGAYMEKERKRANEMGYLSPIQDTKANSDKDYDLALGLIVKNIDRVALCAGTHNEQSSLLLTHLMEENGLDNNHPHIYFSQLLGMSDNLSYNLANAGYNVAKYVPYGPVKAVLPYLFRRANENTAIAGQMSRELNLIIKERKRRAGK